MDEKRKRRGLVENDKDRSHADGFDVADGQPIPKRLVFGLSVRCEFCGGKGKVNMGKIKGKRPVCLKCGGTGWRTRTEEEVAMGLDDRNAKWP